MKKIIFIIIIISIVSINVFALPDFSKIENETVEVTNKTPKDIIDSILNNSLEIDGQNIFGKILSLTFDTVKKVLPHVLSLLAITVILSFVEKLKLINRNCENAVMLGGKIIFAVVIISSSSVFILNAKESLLRISSFTNGLLPIIITLLATIGAQGTVTILGPSQILLSSVLINVCVKIIFPIIIMGFITAIVNELLADKKLQGIAELMKNIATWMMGGIFAIFAAVIALQGTVSGITDGLSIKGIKYALSSSVPVIGSSISDSFSTVILSALSIKCASGVVGILVILGIMIVPIINIWAYIFALNIFSAAVHPFAGDFVHLQIKCVTSFLKLATAVLAGVTVLWFIFLGILISAGGNFV